MHPKLALSVTCLLAIAGISGAAEPARHSYECDTPAGHFSSWSRTVSGRSIDVAGRLAVNELRNDSKWTPTVFVILQGGTDDKSRFGIRLYTVPKSPDTFFLELVKPSGTEKLGLGQMPGTQEPLPFELHLDGNRLRVSFAGLEASSAVGEFKPASVKFSCSTGDFEFRDFTVEERD